MEGIIYEKPLVVYDLESTGLDRNKDRIVQIAAIKYDFNTKKILDSFNSYVKPTGDWKMSYSAYAVHGIGKKQLDTAPTFAEVGPKFLEFIKDCNIGTYNGFRFDNGMLTREFERIGINFIISDLVNFDAFAIEKERHGNTLHDTFKRYYGKTMEECNLNPHDALSDVKGTLAVIIMQNSEKPINQMPKCLSLDGIISMHDFTCNDDVDMLKPWNGKNCACFDVGKYRGMPVEFVKIIDPGYIAWAAGDNSKFDSKTKKFLAAYI